MHLNKEHDNFKGDTNEFFYIIRDMVQHIRKTKSKDIQGDRRKDRQDIWRSYFI
jgi:hypothetical protein